MLFNSVATFSVVLALSAHVNAHAVFNPFIGKPEGTLATRNDAGQGGACGKGNPADITPNKQKLNGKQDAFATATGANGAFKFTGEAFNGGRDGSTKVTMQIDTTGTGKNFQAIGTVTTNGDDPGKPGARVNLAAELGAGTKCTAGPDKNRCLVQVTGAGGFRSCIVVQQAGGGGGGAAAPPPAQNQNNNNNNNQNNNNQNNNNQNNNNQNNNNQNNNNQNNNNQNNNNQNNNQNNNNQGGMTLIQKAAQKVQNGKNAVKAVINKGKNAVKQAVNNTGNKLLQLAKTAKGFVLRPFSMNNVPKGGQVITINKDTGAVEVVKNQKRGMLLPGGRRAFLDREE